MMKNRIGILLVLFLALAFMAAFSGVAAAQEIRIGGANLEHGFSVRCMKN